MSLRRTKMLFNHNHRSKINKRLDEFKINNELNRVKEELDQVKEQLNSSEQKNTELTQKISSMTDKLNIIVEGNKVTEVEAEKIIEEKVEEKVEVVVEEKVEVVVEKKVEEKKVGEKVEVVVEEKVMEEKKVEEKVEVVVEEKVEEKKVEEVVDEAAIGKIRVKKDGGEEVQIEKNAKLINIFVKKEDEENEEEEIICGVPMVECIYCINLVTCKERRTHMKKQFRKNNFEAVFTQAIHPRHPEHRRRYNNSRWVDPGWTQSRCYCVHRCDHNARKLRPTEVSISLSHFQIYQKISQKKQKWALVCEDDLVFCKNFCDIINQIVPNKIWKNQKVTEFERDEEGVDRYTGGYLEDEEIDEGVEEDRPIILFLGGASDNPRLKINEPESFEFIRLQKGNYSNYCYLINLAAAQFLVRKFFPINRPEDSFKRYWISKGKIDCYKVSPSLIGELSAGTNMPAVYNRWSLSKAPPVKKSIPEKEYQKIKEIEGKQIGKSRRLITYNKTRKTKIVKGKK